ncbi:MAG: hypothetical protein WDN69_08810 [Aliidongia sp.]
MKNEPEIEQAFFFGRCDAYMTDVLALANMRTTKGGQSRGIRHPAGTHFQEPAGTGRCASGDKGFYNLIRWTVFTLIEADERGVTARNVADLQKTDDPGLKHFFGTEPRYREGAATR